MTRRKRMIRFEADWLHDPDSGLNEIAFGKNTFALLYEHNKTEKRIIRALGRKEGKIEIVLRRIS